MSANHVREDRSQGTSPPKPTPITYSFSKIPVYLRERAQWVCWRYGLVANSDGEERWTKVPYQARDITRKAATTRPEEWATFEDAVAAAPQCDGIGYCLADGEDIVGVDIDHAVKIQDGKVVGVDEIAKDIIATLQSYTELSVSGTGVHVFAFGTKPGTKSRRGQVEMYSRARFLTFTGRKFKSTPAIIEARLDEIAAVYTKYVAEPEPEPAETPPPASAGVEPDEYTDDEILSLARAAGNGEKFRDLYDGKRKGKYPSQSEADSALCCMLAFWTGKRSSQMDRLFRASKLMRKKWDRVGPETIAHAIEHTTETYEAPPPKPTIGGKSEPDAAWPAPLPMPNDMPATPKITRAMMPAVLSDWVFDIAHRMQCAPDYPATAAIVALGTVVGKKVQIYPKQRDNWNVVPNLWGMAEGEPGVLKSPAVKAALGPLYRLAQEEREQADKAAQVVKEHLAKIAALQAQIKAAKKDEDTSALKAELETLSKQEMVEPVVRRLVTNDATIEKLGMLLNESPNGLLIEREELTGLFYQMEQAGHEVDRSFYLEAWDGRNSKAVDRVLRGSLWVPSCVLSIFGTIQPGPLAAHLAQYYAEGQTDGFIERFQLATYPEMSEWSYVDDEPDHEAIERAWTVFSRLHTIAGEHTVHFTPTAQTAFIEWLKALEVMARDPKVHPILRSHCSKYRSLMPSLALLFQLAMSPRVGDVDLEAAIMAIHWCAYLIGHAQRIYWPILQAGGTAKASLAEHLPSVAGQKLTVREIGRKNWSGLKDPAVIEAALESVVPLHWVRPVAAGRWGSETRWAINPSLSSLSVTPAYERASNLLSSSLPPLREHTHTTHGDSDDGDRVRRPAEDDPLF